MNWTHGHIFVARMVSITEDESFLYPADLNFIGSWGVVDLWDHTRSGLVQSTNYSSTDRVVIINNKYQIENYFCYQFKMTVSCICLQPKRFFNSGTLFANYVHLYRNRLINICLMKYCFCLNVCNCNIRYNGQGGVDRLLSLLHTCGRSTVVYVTAFDHLYTMLGNTRTNIIYCTTYQDFIVIIPSICD